MDSKRFDTEEVSAKMTKSNGVNVDVDQARLNNKVGRKIKPRVWLKPMRESFRPLTLSAIKLFPDDPPA